MNTLNEQHFGKLVECCQSVIAQSDLPASVWVGRGSADWLRSVLKDQNSTLLDLSPENFSKRPFNRMELLDKISKVGPEIDDVTLRNLVIDIFAWGGMSARNARYALPQWDDWKGPCLALVKGLDAVGAYKRFYLLHQSKSLKGVGPAYYTKLIYFLGKGDGLIMDQWTGRSMNLLFGQFITIIPEWNSPDRGSVDSKSDHLVYQKYIDFMSVLSERLSIALERAITPQQAEEFIFSISSKKKSAFLSETQHKIVSAWRKHVIESDR